MIRGIGSTSGCAVGKAVVRAPTRHEIRRRIITAPLVELERLKKAREEYGAELAVLYSQTLQEIDQSSADIFMMYSMIVEDCEIFNNIERMVRAEHVNADYALDYEMKRLCKVFSEMEDEYMRERSSDIANVAAELLLRLAGMQTTAITGSYEGTDDLILVAESLSPADIVKLDRKLVKGVVTERGNIHSHSAILCRAMGLPLVVEAKEAIAEITGGVVVAISGDTGEVFIEPDEATLKHCRVQICTQDRERNHYEKAVHHHAITLDGQEMQAIVALPVS
ncbi:phosphoenolpyruvate-utilizing N-terminal domain-containing protein [Hydrogenoanaerobacterium sp.]|uniref:phosphoenolpyruvate-utilizing N-terminal domain-containing protein n=1 Tax=Hydrogenoanaerobacterium sp. TaxID=2953763 RepID=UPI0028A0CE1F|nr:phosphoenolpyruvate-utilizing N-terminal domain-containing protein [Hydrogenoanaerobacterium sp.]